MPHVIIGTAGHIDHGKTALVKALTGVDTDRLREEKERGMTIDLGFAHLGDRATIIDVPGHEKFIRNMVAGVSTIDLVLFIVAADDGVMPQTREHLDILKILQVKHGIVVITKIDLVEEDWLGLVHDDVRDIVQDSFLENSPILCVSSATQAGVPELRQAIECKWSEIKQKPDKGVFWMPIDRSFSMKGFGTVVTGSVLSGQISVASNVESLPKKATLKVRGLQAHGKSVQQVSTGDRAAVNLQSIAKGDLGRGDVLAETNYFKPSNRFDARLRLLESTAKSLKSGLRLRLHTGTTEVMARVTLLGVSKVNPGESAYVQFHLEKASIARRLDPFVVRQYSPTVTIGGGVILDANARRHKSSDPQTVRALKALEKESPLEVLEERLLSAGFSVLTLDELASELATSKESVENYLRKLEDEDKLIRFKKAGQPAVVHSKNFVRLKELIQQVLSNFHEQNPTRLGLHKPELARHLKSKCEPKLLEHCLDDLKREEFLGENAGILSLKTHKVELSTVQQELKNRLGQMLYKKGFATPSEQEMCEELSVAPQSLKEILDLMIGLSQLVRLEGGIYFHAQRVDEAQEKVVSYLKQNGEITIGQFKDLLGGTSRKYALPLLIYFDGFGITERAGDVRALGTG